MKERVTLTIDGELLTRVDECVDGVKIKNRSHAVELFLMKAFSSNRPRKAVILAGGVRDVKYPPKGPQSLLIVKKKSVLLWNIELLKNHGVKEIMLCITGESSKIREHCGDGSSLGIKISYSMQEDALGTAGSLKAVSEFFTETTIVLNADELKNIDLDDMYEFHKDGSKACTIALTTVDDPSYYGVALMNGTKIITFIEKPAKLAAPSNLINAGLYIVEPEVLNYIPDGFSTIEQDVFPKLAAQEKLYGYIFSGQWFPTKNPLLLDQARQEWNGLN
ncbi:MAG: nucleotidyltransferase family protein [Candidatus Woesearchaeota archaeon]